LFARQYSVFETSSGDRGPAINYTEPLSLQAAGFYLSHLPDMTGWPVLVAAGTSLALALSLRQWNRSLIFWLAWLVTYTLFVLTIGIYSESRYFLFALPAFPGLIAALPGWNDRSRGWTYALAALFGACLAWNAYALTQFPTGVIGDREVAKRLATLKESGNVLVAMPTQAQLMFYYRSETGAPRRQFIRADRTLAIRPPGYSKAKTTMVARDIDDVMEIVDQGRIRFLVVTDSQSEEREEGALLNRVLRAEDQFELLGHFPMKGLRLEELGKETVSLWRFKGLLRDGPSTLPVIVPTADLTFEPG
jgi:hypothetical protein